MLRFSGIEPTTGAEETICGCLRPWRGGISVTAAQEEKLKIHETQRKRKHAFGSKGVALILKIKG
jgi:hypothetical protein